MLLTLFFILLIIALAVGVFFIVNKYFEQSQLTSGLIAVIVFLLGLILCLVVSPLSSPSSSDVVSGHISVSQDNGVAVEFDETINNQNGIIIDKNSDSKVFDFLQRLGEGQDVLLYYQLDKTQDKIKILDAKLLPADKTVNETSTKQSVKDDVVADESEDKITDNENINSNISVDDVSTEIQETSTVTETSNIQPSHPTFSNGSLIVVIIIIACFIGICCGLLFVLKHYSTHKVNNDHDDNI